MKTAVKSTKTNSKEIVSLIKKGDISPLRRARLIYILHNEHNMSQDEIGAAIDVKGAQVYNMLQVSKWPAKVRNHVRLGNLNISEALGLSRKQKSDETFVRTVENFVAANKKQKTPSSSILATLKKENPIQGLDKVGLKKLHSEISRILQEVTGKKPAVRKVNEASKVVAALL